MITLPEIWDILVMRLPQYEWISLQGIYEVDALDHGLAGSSGYGHRVMIYVGIL